jgi:hypothetical protein
MGGAQPTSHGTSGYVGQWQGVHIPNPVAITKECTRPLAAREAEEEAFCIRYIVQKLENCGSKDESF